MAGKRKKTSEKTNKNKKKVHVSKKSEEAIFTLQDDDETRENKIDENDTNGYGKGNK